MRSWSSLAAVAATLLLHLGLVAAVLFGLSDAPSAKPPPESVRVALLEPASHAAPPALEPTVPPIEKRSPRPPRPKRDTPPAPGPKTSPGNALTKSADRPETPTGMTQAAPSSAPSRSDPQPPPTFGPAASGSRSPSPASEPARTSVTDAAYASTNRKPPYPRISQSNLDEGTVILRVLVKADGTAGTVEIKQTSGHPRLDEAARSTVQTWRFSPATVDGKPVAEWYQLAIPFTLQNN